MIDQDGQTPLHLAMFQGRDAECIRLVKQLEQPLQTPDNDCECCSGIPAAAPAGAAAAEQRPL